MKYFLLVYDRRLGRVLEHDEYPEHDRATALRERLARTRRHIANPEIEVVLLGGHSYDDLQKTHARYFKTTEELAEAVASR